MKNPYLLDTPAVVSFSGGRTSGYMLRKIIEAYDGQLPHDIKVVFCNTGKERFETLDFVEECSRRWMVPVSWLEYRFLGRVDVVRKNGKAYRKQSHGFVVVDYETASRDGRPMREAIEARQMLPNVMARFCTVECKIRTTQRYLKSLGWDQWTNAIGFRADEPQRVAKLGTTNRHNNEEPVTPLWKAGVTKEMIHCWWDEQPFQLQLQDHEGNCDLCFLKGKGKVLEILSRRPDLAEWWVGMEAGAIMKNKTRNPSVAKFRNDRPSYQGLLLQAQQPTLFDSFEDDELSIACHCTD